MRQNNKLLIILTIVLLISSVCGVFVAGDEAPKWGGTIVINIDSDPTTFCPVLVQTDEDNLPHQNIFNALVRMNKNLEPIPDLAKSWEISSDMLTYTFYLYENVTWHDGEALTSADVKYTFDLYKEMELPMSGSFEAIESIETPDDYTVVFHLSHPSAPLMATGFAFWRGNKIMPKHLYEGTDIFDNPYNLAPVGSGPFKIEEWVKGSHIIYVRNEDYFMKDKPYLDRIIMRIAPVTEAVTVAFEAGEYSTVSVSPDDIDRMAAITGITVEQSVSGSGSCQYVGINRENEYLSNLKVRQAIAHAIDKEEFIDLALAGQAKPSISFLSSELGWAFNPNVPQYEASTETAELLLDEAEYPRGADGVRFSLRILTMTSEDWILMAQILAAQLGEVGIEVEVMPLEWATLFNKISVEYDFDLLLMGHGTGPDPDRLFGRFLSTEIIPGTWQYMRYNNSRVDELWQASRLASDLDERQALFWEIQEIILTDLPMIPLYENIGFFAYWDEWHDLYKGGFGSLDLWDGVWTDEGSDNPPRVARARVLEEPEDACAQVPRAEDEYDLAISLAETSETLVEPPESDEPDEPEPTDYTLIIIGVAVIALIVAGYLYSKRG